MAASNWIWGTKEQVGVAGMCGDSIHRDVWAGEWCHPSGPFTNKKGSHLYTEIMKQGSSCFKKKAEREDKQKPYRSLRKL